MHFDNPLAAKVVATCTEEDGTMKLMITWDVDKERDKGTMEVFICADCRVGNFKHSVNSSNGCICVPVTYYKK